MTYRHFKYEGWLYVLAFLIALSVRLLHLGAMPLTDAEAAPALQALRLSQSLRPSLDPHPFYIFSTTLLFLFYGGGTNFLARLIPALMGSLLVLAPSLLDDRLKPRPSVILAFFLALDPGLVAISRQIGSPILAITFLAFTVGFINKQRLHWAAVTAAFALLSGPSIWFGLLGLGITFALDQLFKTRAEKPVTELIAEKQETSESKSTDEAATEKDEKPETTVPQPAKFAIQSSVWITFAAAFLIAGTFLFTAPGGIGAAFSSIPAFFSAWVTSSKITPGMVLLSLVVYQPFVLLLTVIALVRGWSRGLRRIVFLSIWMFIALLLVVFMTSREMSDLAWMLIPLNAIASLELVRYFHVFPDERREVLGVILLTAFIWVFAWLGMTGINWLPFNAPDYGVRAGMMVGSLLLLALSLILVSAGWSIRIARLGGVWGLAIGLGALSLSGMFGTTAMRGMDSPELWWLPNMPVQAELLRDTVSQVSDIGMGNIHSADVAILGVQSPSLEWALRENPVRVVDALDPLNAPDFVVTSNEMNPELASAYRGQDFVWRQSPAWEVADFSGWLRWVSLREMPQNQEMIILWARSDLFLDE